MTRAWSRAATSGGRSELSCCSIIISIGQGGTTSMPFRGNKQLWSNSRGGIQLQGSSHSRLTKVMGKGEVWELMTYWKIYSPIIPIKELWGAENSWYFILGIILFFKLLSISLTAYTIPILRAAFSFLSFSNFSFWLLLTRIFLPIFCCKFVNDTKILFSPQSLRKIQFPIAS